MIRGITFDKQLMKSKDHAHEVNYYYQGDMGITKGCTVAENVDGNLVVSSGYFLVKGRLVAVDGSEIVIVPSVASGTLYSILVFEIDLTKENTLTEFNQGSFKIVSDSVAYPTLTQQDLDNGGTLYQFEFVRFENSVSGISALTDTRVVLDMDKYAQKADPTFTGLITTGGQIKFPATQVPSADANTLDDYEEGTFTPVISGTTNAGVGTYTRQSGKYQKIGNVVNIIIDVGWSAHTGTGSLALSGLPFNPSNDSPLAWAISNLTLLANNIIAARCSGGTNTVALRQIATGGGAVAGIAMDTAVDYIILSGSYFV